MEQILSELKSALSQLREKIAKADEASRATELRNVEIDKVKVEQKEKTIELAKRESAVRHIESIVDEAERARALIKEAKIGNEALDEKEKNFAEEKQRFAQHRDRELKEIQVKKEKNDKQAEALIKERNEFEARVRAFKAVQAAV